MATQSTITIDGTLRRVLDPAQPEFAFELESLPVGAVLSFTFGIEQRPHLGATRFAIDFEDRSGTRAALFERQLNGPGWFDERLDLSAHAGKSGRLTLRKHGPQPRFSHSFWVDPVILAPGKRRRPSVILVSIDTLRADRIGLAGHASARTPILDALGRAGVWYANAYSPSAWTLPSHGSLFYGRHLPAHLYEPPGRPLVPALAASLPIAEVLRQAGYLTAAFTGGGYMSAHWGFARGFDTYYQFEHPAPAPGTCPPERFDGAEVFKRAAAWLRGHGQAPFFLFLHTYDVHDRCPFRTRTQRWFEPWSELSPSENARLLAYYDELIAATDTQLGTFLAEVDRLGLGTTTLVIVTSDHGEMFEEHGLRGHGCRLKLYEELVRVPLLLRLPGTIESRGRVDTPVSLIDVAPTVLAILRIPKPPSMVGQILPGLGLGDPPATRPVYVACHDALAVRQGKLKLIAARQADIAPDVSIFDVANDPREQSDLDLQDARLGEHLLALANAYWRVEAEAESGPAPSDVDPGTAERLRALGYLE